MRIGIIGAGHIGATLARQFARIGHEVVISNSRGPQTLQALVQNLGGGVRAVTPAEAVAFGEVVVVSVPYGRYRELPAEGFDGKVVIDTCNYYPERDGHDPDLDSGATTSSEKIRDQLGGADVVKAFNAIHWENIRDRGRPKGDPERLAIPISGGDEDAKAVVAGLIRDIGFDPLDAGYLGRGGSKHQPGTRLYGAELNAEEASALLHTHAG
ncbi:NADP oxidoreductase [Peterkaempfera bronchialis]|uniref:NADP oxidoreductase n=2 Tax=Peterkaempfera bronchialis TaxID=2126346 RepID=A0A345SYR9_9ACTN|nr:NAD(P)-binding domain-containing protein [Peterkaempfera bronchialis]AXI78874.1 NADP oxidoreductase [Peterkaempfera bronchialis]